MKNYLIKKVEKEKIGYDYKVYAINFESPLEQLSSIEKDLAKKGYKGVVLFDLLLSNGNEYNRFVEAYFNGEHFDIKSFRLPILNANVEKDSLRFFKDNKEYLDKGVLSPVEIFILKEKMEVI